MKYSLNRSRFAVAGGNLQVLINLQIESRAGFLLCKAIYIIYVCRQIRMFLFYHKFFS